MKHSAINNATPPLADSHCHFDFSIFDTERAALYQQACANNLQHIIIPGIHPQQWQQALDTSRTYPRCHAAAGIHPHFLEHTSQHSIEQLKQWIEQNTPIAIGECGLDYSKPALSKAQTKEYQRQLFIEQLKLAEHYQLPIIIHSVRATEEVIQHLKQYPSVQGMIHWFSGSQEQAKQLIQMGFYLSYGAAACNPQAKKLQASLKATPLSHLLIETDAPDQALPSQPPPNAPHHLLSIAKQIAHIRNEPLEKIAEHSLNNCQQLFNLPCQ